MYIQPRLGFVFLASGADGSAEELLQGGKWTCDEVESTTIVAPPSVPGQTEPQNPTNVPLVVNLLQATCTSTHSIC